MMDDDIVVIESDFDDDSSSGNGNGQPEIGSGSQYLELRIIGRDLVSFDVTRFGSFIKRIDLSFNFLKSLHGLSVCSETLEELVLDNNQLERVDLGAIFPRLNTVSLNKNRIWHTSTLLRELETYAVNVRFLSLLGNPVCPDQLTSDYVDEAEYPLYRYHILHHLRSVRFLDHLPVTPAELTESKKSSYSTVKLTSTYTPLPSSTRLSRALSAATATRTGAGSTDDGDGDIAQVPHVQVIIPNMASPSGAVTPVIIRTKVPHHSKQGKRLMKYIGKNSEGNRFIKDTDL